MYSVEYLWKKIFVLFVTQNIQIISNDALRSWIRSMLKNVNNYWQSYEQSKICFYIMACGELNHHAGLTDLSGHKRHCLCQQKTHLICYISNKFMRIPPLTPCRDFFRYELFCETPCLKKKIKKNNYFLATILKKMVLSSTSTENVSIMIIWYRIVQLEDK
jgi:hypothetical protein